MYGPFQVRSGDPRLVRRRALPHFRGGLQAPGNRSLAPGERGGEQGGGAVAGVGAGHLPGGLHGAVHEIRAAAAVHVQIDKPGHHPAAAELQPICPGRRAARVRARNDLLDQSGISYYQRAARQDAAGGDDIAANSDRHML